jgi:hypothetical protein
MGESSLGAAAELNKRKDPQRDRREVARRHGHPRARAARRRDPRDGRVNGLSGAPRVV